MNGRPVMRTRGLTTCLLFLLPGLGWPARADAPSRGSAFDLICGPRCVQFLLRYYDRPVPDPIELVKEIQWPDLEKGASFEALDRALRARGVHTKALRVGSRARLRWPYPVLQHLPGDDLGGHFVVWLPPEGPGAGGDIDRVWVGVDGVRSGPWEDLAARRSGVVLLTAPAPITDPLAAVEPSRLGAGVYFGGGGAVVAVLGALARRRRSRPLPPGR